IDAAIKSMTTLNKRAAEVITTGHVDTGDSPVAHVGTATPGCPAEQSSAAFAVHAMTDITGFGLIGHLPEMLLASDVPARISADSIPLLDGALDCVQAGHIPGGLNNNRNFAECLIDYDANVPEDLRALLFDPQTAGGLLISTPEGAALA